MHTRTCVAPAPSPLADTHSSPVALAAAQSETTATTPSSTRLIPVPRGNEYHAWSPQGGLRHLIFNEHTNGFAAAFKRVGRRVLVDGAEFFRCVESSNQKAAA